MSFTIQCENSLIHDDLETFGWVSQRKLMQHIEVSLWVYHNKLITINLTDVDDGERWNSVVKKTIIMKSIRITDCILMKIPQLREI